MIFLQKDWRYVLPMIILSWWFTSPVYAGEGMETTRPSWESQRYLIEGVYYLVNEGDRDTAEEFFRRVIFSSSFSSLSVEDGTDEMPVHTNRWAVSEAFYFLGKIHYEKAISQGATPQNIAQAKKYLEKAHEYGVIYDRLHPPLLDEINRKYPGVDVLDAPLSETSSGNAKMIIEIGHSALGREKGVYEIDAVKVSQNADVTGSIFHTNEEFDLECGARYKMKLNIQRRNKSMYGALTAVGIGLVIWLTRG